MNVGAFGLALFVRDITNNDPVAWIDDRLEFADRAGGEVGRAHRLRDAVALPFGEIAGIGPKLANMIMADLLIGGDPARERWVAAGGAMVAIDSLVHNVLARTGVIESCGTKHAMGPACYRADGCADVIERLVAELSAAGNATILPRQLQHAIWSFASEGGRSICNGRWIDDRRGCEQRWCPARHGCARLALL